MSFFRYFLRNRRGATTLEYGLIAAVMGTGVAVSLNYVATEMQNMVQSRACAIDSPLSLLQRKKFGCDEPKRDNPSQMPH